MGLSISYIPKTGQIHVVTLTAVDTWQQVLTEAQTKGIRGIKVKSRQTFNSSGGYSNQPDPFDIAFTSSPAASDSTGGNGFYSVSPQGFGDVFAPTHGLWARSPVSGCIIEAIIYE